MTDRSRSAPALARFGLTDPRAEPQLRAVGWWGTAGPADGSEPMLVALSRSPDPDLALRGVDRLREADEDGWPELARALRDDRVLRGKLFGVLGTSVALADFLASQPDRWRCLARYGGPDPDQPVVTRMLAAVGADPHDGPPGTPHGTRAGIHGADAVRVLKLAYRTELLRIAAADLGHLIDPAIDRRSYEQVAAELTDLADATLRAALAVAVTEVYDDQDLDCQLAIIAMGKCGGHELNYVSDVDVIFVGDGDIAKATRLASRTMRVATEVAFEVDAALRPEGKAGALVRTLDGHVAYYRRWARTWEFQALLKARPVAGDIKLGRAYLEAVGPMVWTAADREDFVADVRAMRRRVEDHVPPALVERELKLGRGGLRDVEFAVQLLQLVHGRNDARLRLPSTLDALAALRTGGYVGRTDADELAESYRFLRGVEHRLQLRRLRRTHLFPDDQDHTELRWLARAMGIRPTGGRSAGETLVAEFRRHGNRVRRLHEKLFYRPLLEAVARKHTDELRLTAEQAITRLAALGYAAPDGALRHIEALTEGVSRRAAIQSTLLPVLLDLLADTPDPDGGLLAYRRLSEALASTPWYLRLLRDEGAAFERLAVLLGTSKLVPDLMIRAPEVLQLLARTNELAGRDPADVARSLYAAARRHSDVEEAVAAARALRRHELLRVASADLLGLMPLSSVCAALSSVWVAVLEAALAAVVRAKTVEDGGTAPARIAVIAMGRLGGAELGYGSDADVLFVCEANPGVSGPEAVRWAGSVAETLRIALGSPSSDPPLLVDAGLRPEGRQGPLVRTLESYRAYYTKRADPWEAQALLRAAPAAGDADLAARFLAAIDPVRYPADGLDQTQVREIRRIKARVDSERLPRGADPSTHTKLGRGGLADIEWTVQLLQLRHGGQVPELRTPSTIDGITAANAAGLLTNADAAALTSAWTLATKARNATMLVRGKASDQLPTTMRELVAVAGIVTRENLIEPGSFLDDYRRTTRRARAVVERVFYEDD
jgi:glutamate-ammonia-ligase adenylyltransferase